MTAAHTFKVGDLVLYYVGAEDIHTVLGVHGPYLWLKKDTDQCWSTLAHHCRPYIPPPVRTRYLIDTDRRVPQEGEFCVNGNHLMVSNGQQQLDYGVIVAITRQDGDQLNDRLSDSWRKTAQAIIDGGDALEVRLEELSRQDGDQ